MQYQVLCQSKHTRERGKYYIYAEHNYEYSFAETFQNDREISSDGSQKFDDLLLLLLVAVGTGYLTRNRKLSQHFCGFFLSPFLVLWWILCWFYYILLFLFSCVVLPFPFWAPLPMCAVRAMCENPVFQMWLNAIGIRILLTGLGCFRSFAALLFAQMCCVYTNMAIRHNRIPINCLRPVNKH